MATIAPFSRERSPNYPEPFASRMAGLKVPHMGWNEVRQARPHPLWRGIPDGSRFYFAHSYHPVPADPDIPPPEPASPLSRRGATT